MSNEVKPRHPLRPNFQELTPEVVKYLIGVMNIGRYFMYDLVENTYPKLDFLLRPIQKWLAKLEIKEEKVARRIVKVIPAQCPFARQIRLFNHVLFKIPPMCKLNPLYDDLMMLRFRALCYLAEECGE